MPDESNPAVWQTPEVAPRSLQNIRRAAPLSIEQVDIMLRLINAACSHVHWFLGLGCGDSLLASAILDEHPHARCVMVDSSEARLDSSRQHLRPHIGRVDFLRADLNQPDWGAALAAQKPFDAVISAFTIHLLSDPQKQAAYNTAFRLLRPEGIFINIEHVASATRWTESVWDDYTIDSIFGGHLQQSDGRTRAQVAREYYESALPEAPVLAPLEVQCDWLRSCGFESVECYLKVLELAVFGGQKPAV